MPREKFACAVDPKLVFIPSFTDGDPLVRGDSIATVEGAMRSILAAERTALNFLQRLSGVATLTRQFVDAVAGLTAKILDTRKTTPGWRLLEKYAVRCGGGVNHRAGLYDMVLIKDNHLAAMQTAKGKRKNGIQAAIDAARSTYPTLPVEVEVETPEQFETALAARPDIVLLDNMSVQQMRDAVAKRNASAPTVQLEASGGVNLQTVAQSPRPRLTASASGH